MTRLTWTTPGSRFYETGVDRGVLYPADGPGVPWNGLISVKEAPSDSDSVVRYLDGSRYTAQQGAGSFAATIEAFTYPDEFEEYGSLRLSGGLLQRKTFGLSYRTKIGNDISGLDSGYRLHLVYNARATPAQINRTSMDTSLAPINLAWDISTKPIQIAGARPSAHLIVDASLAPRASVEQLEAMLYGTETSASVLPQPNDVIDVFDANAVVKIIDNGDGTWTASGPEDYIQMLDPSTFQINVGSAVYMDADTYRISSW